MASLSITFLVYDVLRSKLYPVRIGRPAISKTRSDLIVVGLFIYPSLLPVEVQTALLNKLVHRDLSDPNHKTNLHLHYHMPATSTENGKAASFFDLDHSLTVQPKDPNIHKPISVTQMLEKKLRWVTLGGQYDWTQKVYPKGDQPEFPSDVAELLQGFFPSVDPQAAILNLYSPGDTLSLHRDVSEECDRGLISLSIGCDAIFLAANSDGSEMATIRLCSGDALLMSGKSRFAWHAVPKVLPGTCPKTIQPWPANSVGFAHEQWRGWLTNKRINLNVRQMRDGTAPSQDVPIDS